jgi:hypothetical protein
LSDVITKFSIIAIFLIINFPICFVGMFIIYLHTKFHICNSSSPTIIAIRMKDK